MLGIVGIGFYLHKGCASMDASYGPVSICPSFCVCQKSVFLRNWWTYLAGFCGEGFFQPVLHCVIKKFRYVQKYGYFPLELCPKLQTWKISPQHIDC